MVSKHKNIKCELDGYKFDSHAERDRYAELKLVERAEGDDRIQALIVKPTFTLQDAFLDHHGNRYHAIKFTPDFQYCERGVIVIEDVKGLTAPITEAFNTKMKWLICQHPQIEFRIHRR
jgi:hypothetical protein